MREIALAATVSSAVESNNTNMHASPLSPLLKPPAASPIPISIGTEPSAYRIHTSHFFIELRAAGESPPSPAELGKENVEQAARQARDIPVFGRAGNFNSLFGEKKSLFGRVGNCHGTNSNHWAFRNGFSEIGLKRADFPVFSLLPGNPVASDPRRPPEIQRHRELGMGRLLPRHHEVTEPRTEPMAGIVLHGAHFGAVPRAPETRLAVRSSLVAKLTRTWQLSRIELFWP
jgi:hypothetical protein